MRYGSRTKCWFWFAWGAGFTALCAYWWIQTGNPLYAICGIIDAVCAGFWGWVLANGYYDGSR